MHTKFVAIAAAAAMTGLLGASIALAQPTITNPSGGTGNSEMDHSRMGGSQGQTTPGPAPVLTNPGGGSGNAEMDHSRMGGGTPGVGTPGGSRMGSPSGDGPEVRHGNEPRPGSPPNPAPRPRN